VCAALAVVMLVAMVWLAKARKGGGGLVAATVILTAVHPAWTVSAIHGDCGMFKASSSMVVTLILFALLLVQMTLTVRAKKRARLGDSGTS
jgi:apolipoprotein N-acyltransferase